MKNSILSGFCCVMGVLGASELTVFDDQLYTRIGQTSDPVEIAEVLRPLGIRFEQWEANAPLSDASTEEEIRLAYQHDIERLQRENGYQTVDILRMTPDHPNKVQLRQKFLNEHTHDEDEVRFFVQGSGNFFLHLDGRVYSVLCERGDLISIPPFYRHWFDMGTHPSFIAIRFFTRMEGWIAHFTDDPISQHFIQGDGSL